MSIYRSSACFHATERKSNPLESRELSRATFRAVNLKVYLYGKKLFAT